MMEIINMFWVVVIFWLAIEFIAFRINRNKKTGRVEDQFISKIE